MNCNRFLALMLASMAALSAPLQAYAQGDFPDKPITMIVPFPAGGAADSAARAAMNGLSIALGQPVIIDNKPGAGGNIGVAFAARAKADGYTLLLGHISPITINPHTYGKLAVDPMKELAPIGLISSGPMILVVHPSVPARTLPEFIAYAKANPGAVNYASAGAGGITHVAMELLSSKAGIQMTHVPYKGGAPALQDLLAGRVQAMSDALPQLLPYVKEGKLRAIAVTSAQRSPYAPDVPTAAEGGLHDYILSGWLSVFVPAKTPETIRRRIKEGLDVAVTSTAYADFLTAAFSPKIKPMSTEDFTKFVQAEYVRWGKVVHDANILLD
ncbi:tripartite tricarboxylate transporter substrate binding protein [Variovorax sp. 770b2]|jgi:tripartite-type tricarboxylate transporter receptor subunit TctC|uniref:Bug family tripartite tricarboxylate transporter substrate binding protein n=1 Tax=Variovorax sp. 770b2 TaxID=1566271 RepID=UPI0008E61600|nr:tripartite tricarboxylate transporter substrate binding protein [Variovorax sp. 770b2]SFP45587.1 Tripartite-type tricarboxylate transporter, receptor component TctC [Variovorax sp. 770b2]